MENINDSYKSKTIEFFYGNSLFFFKQFFNSHRAIDLFWMQLFSFYNVSTWLQIFNMTEKCTSMILTFSQMNERNVLLMLTLRWQFDAFVLTLWNAHEWQHILNRMCCWRATKHLVLTRAHIVSKFKHSFGICCIVFFVCKINKFS